MTVYTVSVRKVTNNYRPNGNTLRSQLEYMRRRALAGGRQNHGWDAADPEIVAPRPKELPDSQIEYLYTFRFNKKKGNKITEAGQFETIQRMIGNAGNSRGWSVVNASVDHEGNQSVPVIDVDNSAPFVFKALAESQYDLDINMNAEGYFDHLVDRDIQVDMLLSAVRTAVETDFKIRPHILLYGPASSGKTSLMSAVEDMVGSEYCYNAQASTSTGAGIIKDWSESGCNPLPFKFLFLDEIDKVNDAFKFLLPLMDHRGEVKVKNTRNDFHAKCPMLVIGTCNNLPRMEKVLDGALISRFANQIHVPALSHAKIKEVILERTKALHTQPEWVDAALTWCGIHQPDADVRKLISYVSMGRERWVGGEYGKMLQKVGG